MDRSEQPANCPRRTIASRRRVWLVAVLLALGFSLIDTGECSAQQRRRLGAAPQNVELSAEEVRAAIDKAVRFLKGNQSADRGNWTDFKYKCGVSALVTLSLLQAGERPDDPQIERAIRHVKSFRADELSTYALSLRIMVLAGADPAGRVHRADIASDINMLLQWQVTEGRNAGGWTYNSNGSPTRRSTAADASNTQFAILAMNDAARMGIEIGDEYWERSEDYWERCFVQQHGGFDYVAQGTQHLGVTGSMTCAGIASTIIISDNLADGQNMIVNGNLNCCGKDRNIDRLEAAYEWMGKNLSVAGNPAGGQRGNIDTKLYYLYALERAGRLSGRRFFGPHDWYRAGASELVNSQALNGSWKGGHSMGESEPNIASSFALLFLSKGKRPVVIGKYHHGVANDWDLHPKGVHQLTRNLEQQWNAKLAWQTIDSTKATANELLETPVLFISGQRMLKLDQKQKDALKEYVENGGFIFAEACQGDGCGDVGEFDAQFQTLMDELFPDSPLDPLAVDHPIWNAHFNLTPSKTRPLLGLQACCRTSVVYCPRNLACLWRVDRPSLLKLCNQATKQEVEYTSQLGINVVSYATGRQVRDKLDTPQVDEAVEARGVGERVIVLPKLQHSGGADEAPNAWRKVKRQAAVDAQLLIKMDKKMINPTAEELVEPLIFMHGRDRFQFKAEEQDALREYLSSGFGLLFVDSICTSDRFTGSFRREMQRIFPDQPLEEIPGDDPLWTQPEFGFPLEQVTLRVPDAGVQGGFRDVLTRPRLEGIKIDGRWVVIFSPYDLSCALENSAVSQCEGYTHADAMTICLKILLYRLQSD